MNNPSKEQAANLLDQIQISDEAVMQEVQQSTLTQPEVGAAAVKLNGFSMLLDHLKSEALRREKRARLRRQSSSSYAA